MTLDTLPGVHAKERIIDALARLAAAAPSHRFRAEVVRRVMAADPDAVLQGTGPILNRRAELDRMPLDLEPAGRLEFEDLAGMFASTSLNHGLVGMTIRQAAYLFGVARRSGARRAIEIGRWRGGSTIAITAGMGPEGRLWSIDLGEKERRVGGASRPLDAQIRDFLDRFGLDAQLLIGDSRTIEVGTGEVDLVFIDGDHTYDGVRSDFERFGRRVRLGGAVLLDDVFPEEHFTTHADTVGRLVTEVTTTGDFRLVKAVDRLAHLERVR